MDEWWVYVYGHAALPLLHPSIHDLFVFEQCFVVVHVCVCESDTRLYLSVSVCIHA